MIRNDFLPAQGEPRRLRRWKPVLGVLGGVLYVVAALVVMQVAFHIWAGMW
jgi:hypothetical protein